MKNFIFIITIALIFQGCSAINSIETVGPITGTKFNVKSATIQDDFNWDDCYKLGYVTNDEFHNECRAHLLTNTPDKCYKGYSLISIGRNAFKRECREKYVSLHPNLPNDIKEAIKEGQLKLGMSIEQTLATWGDPEDTNKTVGSWGTHHQLVYNNCTKYQSYCPNKTYVYIKNDKIASWQN